MGIILATLASLCFVLLDVLRKLLGQRLSSTQIVIGINLGSALILFILVGQLGTIEWDWLFVALGVFEAIIFSVASILYVQAVTLSPLSLTIPYLAFTPVISTIVAIFLIHEVPSVQGFAGIALVVAGAVLLHMSPKHRFGELLKAPLREPGSWRMLIVAVTWGITTSIDKIAIAHGSEILLGFVLTAGSALLLIILSAFGFSLIPEPVGTPKSGTPWKDPLLFLAGLTGALAVLCQFFAYRELLVAYVETIKRAGGIFSVLIGIFIFQEGGLRERLPAAVMMVAGTILIFL